MGAPRKLIGGAAVLGAAVLSAAGLTRHRRTDLPPPPTGTPGRYPWRHADVFFTRRGEGPSALLLHDLYSGASGHEMDALAGRLAPHFAVYTIDLPGFGRSGRPRMRYGPDFYFEVIVEFVRHQIDSPTLVVGAGVTAGFVPEAALRLGNSVSGVVLIAPPEPEGPGVIETATWRPLLYQLLRSPFGTAAVRWSSSRRRRRAVLERDLIIESEEVDERADVLHRNARQKAAGWPLWSLWAGDLAWDPRAALSRVGAPSLVLWGAEARINAAAPDTYRTVRPDLTQDVIPGTARWPHVDDDETVSERIVEWWATVNPDTGHGDPA